MNTRRAQTLWFVVEIVIGMFCLVKYSTLRLCRVVEGKNKGVGPLLGNVMADNSPHSPDPSLGGKLSGG